MNYTKAEADYTEAEADYTKTEMNYTKAEADYTEAEADYTKAEMNYTKAEADYMRAEMGYGQFFDRHLAPDGVLGSFLAMSPPPDWFWAFGEVMMVWCGFGGMLVSKC